MKKFMTIAIAAATVATMTASAFAEGLTATYDKEANTATATITAESAEFGDQMTVVIVPAGAESITADNIWYINQDAATNEATLLTGMGVKAELPDGTYEVRVGGSAGNIYTGTFTKSSTPEGPTYTYGDVNEIDGVTAVDANLVLQHCAELITLEGNGLLAADVNGADGVTAVDANLILQYCAELITQFPAESN